MSKTYRDNKESDFKNYKDRKREQEEYDVEDNELEAIEDWKERNQD